MEREVSERLNDCRRVYPPARCVMAVAYRHKRRWEGLNGNMSNLFVRGRGGESAEMVCQECCQCCYKTFSRLTFSHLSAGCQVRDLCVSEESPLSATGNVFCKSMSAVKIKIKLLSKLKTYKAFLLYVLKLNGSTDIMAADQSRSDQPQER